jgi:integrase
LKRLMLWWGQPAFAMKDMRERTGKSRRMTGHLTDIDASTCAAYIGHVGAQRSGAMDLSMLRAAQRHAVDEGKLTRAMKVTLPGPAPPRERWLTRSEAARVCLKAWRHRRDRNGISGEADNWATRKHLARFIIASLYTGTRKETVLLAAFERIPGYGFIDLDAGLWYRKPFGKRATKKRQTPVRIPDRLLSHMRRWREAGQKFLIEFNGEPVDRIDKAFRELIKDCALTGEKVTPHTLKHTAITWALQSGMQPWDASGYFGVTLDTLERVYGHHSPQHLKAAAAIMGRAGKVAETALTPQQDRGAKKAI